jgi:hypothetical protein
MTRAEIVAHTIAEITGQSVDSDKVIEIVNMIRESKPSEEWDRNISLREVDNVFAAFKEEASGAIAFLNKKKPSNALGASVPPDLVKKLLKFIEE